MYTIGAEYPGAAPPVKNNDDEAIIDESDEYLDNKKIMIQHDMKTMPNKMFIENVWCFGDKDLDLFRYSRKANLDEFFA